MVLYLVAHSQNYANYIMPTLMMIIMPTLMIKVYLKGEERGAIFSRDLDGMAWRVMAPSYWCLKLQNVFNLTLDGCKNFSSSRSLSLFHKICPSVWLFLVALLWMWQALMFWALLRWEWQQTNGESTRNQEAIWMIKMKKILMTCKDCTHLPYTKWVLL